MIQIVRRPSLLLRSERRAARCSVDQRGCRGLVFPCETRRGERDKALRTKRRDQNDHRNETALAAMDRAIARGVRRDKAIISAVKSGASYQAIAEDLGLSRQRVQQIVAPVLGYRTP
jgi:DNA-binding NarL/FixJ family response regulator